MKNLIFSIFKLFPLKLLSYYCGLLMHIKRPAPLVKWLQRSFIQLFKIPEDEAEHPLTNYSSLGQFFTRKLKPNLRVAKSNFCSPCDGTIKTLGPVDVTSHQRFLVKGVDYHWKEMFWTDENIALKITKPLSHAIIYLSPKNYHRVHSPINGTLVKVNYYEGKLLPVVPFFAKHFPQLFSLNERLVFHIENELGTRVWLAMIGSVNVGKISTPFIPEFYTNSGSQTKEWKINYPIHQLQELGIFHLGSTVCMLWESETQKSWANNKQSQIVQLGDSL